MQRGLVGVVQAVVVFYPALRSEADPSGVDSSIVVLQRLNLLRSKSAESLPGLVHEVITARTFHQESHDVFRTAHRQT